MAYEALSEAAIRTVLDAFYEKVRADPDLGPVFAKAIPDDAWPAHMAVIQDFWSSVMLKTGRYKRNPFAVHMGVEGISPALFHAVLGPPLAEEMHDRAIRIGESLQAGLFFRPGAIMATG
jgi:hemoglobin